MTEPDWMESRTYINTVGELRQVISQLADTLQLPVKGFYDGGFGVADNVSVGISVSGKGEKYFAIDVEDFMSDRRHG